MKARLKYGSSRWWLSHKGLLGLFAFLCLSSFQPSWKLLSEITLEAKDIQTDRLGNLYVVSLTNQLYKFDPNGKLLSTLNYAYLGNITHIDASNPLELYLFYREMNAVVFLDNNLAYRGKINLSDAHIVQASAMARTYANGLWIFDQGDLQLKKLEKDGQLIQASGNVMQFAQNNNLNPTHICENGSRVFVTDPKEGILVFDVFANYIKTIPVKGVQEIRVLNEELFYPYKHSLVSYRLNTLQRDTLQVPDSNFTEFSLEKERLFLMKPKSVCIFAFENR